MKSKQPEGAAAPVNQGRRQWLGKTGLLVASSALLPLATSSHADSPAADPAPSAADIDAFHELGLLLTGRQDLPLDISTRLLHALEHEQPGFQTRAKQLAAALAKADIKHIDAFPGSSVAADPAMHETAMKIISGWYLGYTGTPVSLSDTDNTQFITYTAALMYERTREVTVIPTYSRAGTDYWQAPPPVLKDA